MSHFRWRSGCGPGLALRSQLPRWRPPSRQRRAFVGETRPGWRPTQSQGLGSKRPPESRSHDPTDTADRAASPKCGIRCAVRRTAVDPAPTWRGPLPVVRPVSRGRPPIARVSSLDGRITISGEPRGFEAANTRRYLTTAGTFDTTGILQRLQGREPLPTLRGALPTVSRPLLRRPGHRPGSESGRWLCRDTPGSEWRRCEIGRSTRGWNADGAALQDGAGELSSADEKIPRIGLRVCAGRSRIAPS